MGVVQGILTFLGWWLDLFIDGLVYLFCRDNKLDVKKIFIIAGVVAVFMTLLILIFGE